MRRLASTIGFIGRHPLARRRPHVAYWRFARWQIESRLRGDVEVPWVSGARLVARRGMTGATGNIYCGLHEFADMGFTLHLLRPADVFVDIGANVGSYTVLAGAVCGSDVIAIEPDPGTAERLRRNVTANGIGDRVRLMQCCVGATSGVVRFSVGHDTTNRVLAAGDAEGRDVEVQPLDAIVGDAHPLLLKIDVEGHEPHVVAGALRVLAEPGLQALLIETVDEGVLAHLAAAGFRRATYEPFSRRLDWAASGEHTVCGNWLFVRDIEFCRKRTATAPRRSILGQSI